MDNSEPLLIIKDSMELRFILPIAPFGVIGGFLIIIILHNISMLHLIDTPTLYILSLGIGVVISELYYFYRNSIIYFYKEKVKVFKGKKVKNIFFYEEIVEVRYSESFSLGGGPSAGKQSYVELKLQNGNIVRLIFGGFFQKENLKKSLRIFQKNGVKIARSSR